MHTGAESTPPGDQSMQFVFYVKWGMTPVEAATLATWLPARRPALNTIGLVALNTPCSSACYGVG